MKRTTAIKTALGVAFAAAIGLSAPAYALDAGQCGSKAEIAAALHDEGQVQIISGQRAAIGAPKNVFTVNSDLSLGYNIESGVDNEAGKACVAAKYTNIRLNGDPNVAQPTWATFGPGTAHDQYLARMRAKVNERVLMGATALVRRPDGSEVKGPFLMFSAGDHVANGMDGMSGSATATNSQGGITTLANLGGVETNGNFQALAKSRVQTASIDLMVLARR